MFKLLTIGVLVYLIYRFTVKPTLIDTPAGNTTFKKKPDEDGDFVDYEEIED